jgi:hypothetical protein
VNQVIAHEDGLLNRPLNHLGLSPGLSI